MSDPTRGELLEIYRLHAELADRVGQRREGTNRLYLFLLVGLVLSLVIFASLGDGEFPVEFYSRVVGVVGAVLSVSWYIVIRSYRQLNTGKFAALHELEEKLPFPFFKREWELLGEGKKPGRYWKLTVVETGLPIVFFVLSVVLIVTSLD